MTKSKSKAKPRDLHDNGYRVSENPTEFNGRVAIAQLGSRKPILGIVRDLVSPAGVGFPSFSVYAEGYLLPIIYLVSDGPGKTLDISVMDQTISEYLTEPRRALARIAYEMFCNHFKFRIDDHCALNAVYYLEEEDLLDVSDDNLQEVADLFVAVRRAFYLYIDAISLRPEELADMPRFN